MKTNDFIKASWPAHPTIHAYTTTRSLGNIATHVEDDPQSVASNRQKLNETIALPNPPCWLEQVHGTQCITLSASTSEVLTADAAYTNTAQTVCTIMTADCLPILLCNESGTEVAAIHAGWRGLLAGVIDNTVACMSSSPNTIMAWLGPAISKKAFEINEDIKKDYLMNNEAYEPAFHYRENRLFADLYHLARINLAKLGIEQVFGGQYCTFFNNDLFFSHRHDPKPTGRIASLIWINR